MKVILFLNFKMLTKNLNKITTPFQQLPSEISSRHFCYILVSSTVTVNSLIKICFICHKDVSF